MTRHPAALLGVFCIYLCAVAALTTAMADGTKRIVVAGGDLAEIAFALGAGDQIVGVDSTATFPPAATERAQIGYVRRLSAECVPWLHKRGISVLGCDGANDVYPGPQIEGWLMPIHQCTLVAMGVHLLDNLRLDELSSICAENNQYDFQFSIAPLRVEGGTGSPCNPIAVL